MMRAQKVGFMASIAVAAFAATLSEFFNAISQSASMSTQMVWHYQTFWYAQYSEVIALDACIALPFILLLPRLSFRNKLKLVAVGIFSFLNIMFYLSSYLAVTVGLTNPLTELSLRVLSVWQMNSFWINQILPVHFDYVLLGLFLTMLCIVFYLRSSSVGRITSGLETLALASLTMCILGAEVFFGGPYWNMYFVTVLANTNYAWITNHWITSTSLFTGALTGIARLAIWRTSSK